MPVTKAQSKQVLLNLVIIFLIIGVPVLLSVNLMMETSSFYLILLLMAVFLGVVFINYRKLVKRRALLHFFLFFAVSLIATVVSGFESSMEIFLVEGGRRAAGCRQQRFDRRSAIRRTHFVAHSQYAKRARY